ncbi:ommochrome-binding protein-like [Battus philenor]|uniref:ommochrome-binding protein-like n=1 Tax=Battus philenor TaxID=42288 RepID=UPI0035CE96F5
MMQILILLSTLAAIQSAAVSEEKECEGVIIDGVYHDKEVLKTDLDRPYSLAVDFGTNILYFSYSLKKTDDVFKSVKINLYTKEYSEVEGIDNGFVHTVDQNNHVPYIGTSQGIYKYNYTTRTSAIVYGASDSDIWEIYFKDALYYSDFPSQFLYVLKYGESMRFKELEHTKVIHFAIDKDDVMFFTNGTGLYSQPIGTEDAYLYEKLENGERVRGFANDLKGNVYACFQDGIYKVDTATGTLKLIVPVDDAFGVAFDANNNIVYSDYQSVIHLKPNKNKTC